MIKDLQFIFPGLLQYSKWSNVIPTHANQLWEEIFYNLHIIAPCLPSLVYRLLTCWWEGIRRYCDIYTCWWNVSYLLNPLALELVSSWGILESCPVKKILAPSEVILWGTIKIVNIYKIILPDNIGGLGISAGWYGDGSSGPSDRGRDDDIYDNEGVGGDEPSLDEGDDISTLIDSHHY